ncbi:retrovirus-related pol polyprotein from transposon TNT 1-94, partial [Tanacetum coccineum]
VVQILDSGTTMLQELWGMVTISYGKCYYLKAKDGLTRGIPRLKFQKDHLCSTCALGKSKKSSHQPKAEDTNQEKLYLLHMDLCGPMRVASINGKRYILVIFDDYSRFTWVRFLRTKDEAPEAIIKCIKNIQVSLNATVRNVRTDNGTEFVNQTLREFYENVGISHQTSVARTPWQNGIVERQNRTLVEVARTISGSGLHSMTPATPCSGLVPNLPSLTPFVPPSRKEWDIVFKPMFDEFYSPPASVASPVHVVEAPAPVDSTGSPSSTTVDQDAPSPSTSQTTLQSQSQAIPLSAEEESHDHEIAHMSNDPYFGIPIPENVNEESSSSDAISTTMHPNALISEHPIKWTKDHPLQNIIGELSRPVSTQLQLHEQALFCYYDAFLIRSFKTQDCLDLYI